MTGLLEAGYGPRDVADQHLVVRVVRVAVREIHGNLRRVRRQIERRPHAPVDLHLFGTRVILDHVPRAFNLKIAFRFVIIILSSSIYRDRFSSRARSGHIPVPCFLL